MTPSALRRVIPSGYQVCLLHLDGETPLLMSSGEADRRSDTYRAYRALSKKRGKTIEDEDRLGELEWYTRLYYDEELGPYIPGKNVKELLRSAATKWRQGENVRRSLVIPDYRIPLTYKGPRDPVGLWEANFAYTTMVAMSGPSGGRVERCRPCFDTWSLECEIAYDPEDLDFPDLSMFVERSEKYGLGDYRPDFGAFRASLEVLRIEQRPSKAVAAKTRDAKAETANLKRLAKLTA